MSEMIKRVASALCRLDGHDPDAVGGDAFDDGHPHWWFYQPEARAAIAEITKGAEPCGVCGSAVYHK